MGQAAKSYLRVEFGQDVPIKLTSATAVEQAMLKHYFDTNPEAVGKPDITIVDFDIYDSEIEVELYSTRRINLDFQIDLFKDTINGICDDVVEINEDTWVQG
jgi:hypothetical protein